MNFILKIGLEIEGGWIQTLSSGFPIKGDGSVSFKKIAFKNRRQETVKLYTGEIASSPLSGLPEIRQWIEKYWPHKKNKTCGFHIHVSFKQDKYYNILMTEDFYKEFLAAAARFGHENRMSKQFFERLAGNNHFCKREFKAHSQVHATQKINERYTHLNYCRALRGTIENRLPAGTMPKGKAFKTVNWFIELIENYIQKEITKQEERFLPISQKATY